MDSNNQWHVGAMNDGLFIINTKPRPSNDEVWHDRPDGPTVVLRASGLSIEDAQAICDAHNGTLSPEAQPEVTEAVAYPTLSPELLTALRRCEETMSDDNSYDIDAETMQKLAAFGAVWHRGGGYYTITEIGEFLLSGKIASSSAIEAAVREKLEAAIAAALAEKVDAEATGTESDIAYNAAIGHAVEAIRALMESPHTSVEEPAN